MAYTLADLDTIRAAKAKGERVVQYKDMTVTYRTMEELRQAEADIVAELRANGMLPQRSRQTLLVQSSKGFCG